MNGNNGSVIRQGALSSRIRWAHRSCQPLFLSCYSLCKMYIFGNWRYQGCSLNHMSIEESLYPFLHSTSFGTHQSVCLFQNWTESTDVSFSQSWFETTLRTQKSVTISFSIVYVVPSMLTCCACSFYAHRSGLAVHLSPIRIPSRLKMSGN